MLRDKTGADGDGVALVGQALGGDSPRLRINKLQTETEKSEQRGIEDILRGMYRAIRNPRSHEQIEDTQETADAIIHFANYLMGIIRGAEEPFVLSKFMTRVLDPDFVRSQRYAELLVEAIPTNKRLDTLISVYREKLNGDIYNVGLVVRALLGRLTEDQRKQYLAVVSDEISTVTDEKELRCNLHLMPPIYWQQLQEISRMRVENRVIRAIKEGQSINGRCQRGALATWAREHFAYFTSKHQVGIVLVDKLETDDRSESLYVVEGFFQQLLMTVGATHQIARCVRAISAMVRQGNEVARSALLQNVQALPEDWQKEFARELKDLTNENNPAAYLPFDSAPFLSSDFPIHEDDIPF
jgi:uncharacterized protein (TIGR02391 family)